jgi:hypothetical protein
VRLSRGRRATAEGRRTTAGAPVPAAAAPVAGRTAGTRTTSRGVVCIAVLGGRSALGRWVISIRVCVRHSGYDGGYVSKNDE